MLDKEGSPEKVIAKLVRPGIPARLDIPIPPLLIDSVLPEVDA